MRKIIVVFCGMLAFLGCNDGSVPKPENLIAKDKMIDILYDISLLEAVKSQNANTGIGNQVSNEFIYKKYKIDSVTFVNSNKYYASDFEEYKKMYDQVKERLDKKAVDIEREMNKKGDVVPANPNSTSNSDAPQIQ